MNKQQSFIKSHKTSATLFVETLITSLLLTETIFFLQTLWKFKNQESNPDPPPPFLGAPVYPGRVQLAPTSTMKNTKIMS